MRNIFNMYMYFENFSKRRICSEVKILGELSCKVFFIFLGII